MHIRTEGNDTVLKDAHDDLKYTMVSRLTKNKKHCSDQFDSTGNELPTRLSCCVYSLLHIDSLMLLLCSLKFICLFR